MVTYENHQTYHDVKLFSGIIRDSMIIKYEQHQLGCVMDKLQY